MASLPRHAVVIVHGIGEQRPLETLRSFVQRKHPSEASHDGGVVHRRHVFFGAPDRLFGTFFQRVLKVSWVHTPPPTPLPDVEPPLTVTRRSANTDFYELYWASQFNGTTAGQVVRWLAPLAARRRASLVSSRLRGTSTAWRAMARVLRYAAFFVTVALALHGVRDHFDLPGWLAVLISAGLACAAVAASGYAGVLSLFRTALSYVAGVTIAVAILRLDNHSGAGRFLSAALSGAAVAGVGTFLLGKATRSFGDVARYLDNTPESVPAAEAVRVQAVALLKALHEARHERTGRPKYERVIVVGHSLGSVIAYDAIRNYWAEAHLAIAFPDDGVDEFSADLVAEVERRGLALSEVATVPRRDDGPVDTAVTAARSSYRTAQARLQSYLRLEPAHAGEEKRTDGGRWIVSDLITLGSPLSHADLLMARGKVDLSNMLNERLLLTCPPVRQLSRDADARPYRFRVAGNGVTPRGTRLHHAAAFAAVRWTNVYFRHDLIGGPVAHLFGAGVQDVELSGPSWSCAFGFRYPHSSYWNYPPIPANRPGFLASREILRTTIERRPGLRVMLPDTDGAGVRTAFALLEACQGKSGDAELRVIVATEAATLQIWDDTISVAADADVLAAITAYAPSGLEWGVSVSPFDAQTDLPGDQDAFGDVDTDAGAALDLNDLNDLLVLGGILAVGGEEEEEEEEAEEEAYSGEEESDA